MTLDVIGGILLMITVAALLASAVGRQRAAATRLAEQRAAIRLAEQAILEWNASGSAPAHADVSFRLLPDASPAGTRWVELTATVRGRAATFAALVPAASATEANP